MPELSQLSTLVFDVDGVFTDGKVIVDPSGELLRTMCIRDGYAVKRALSAGLRICIITGGRSEAVRLRFKNLGVSDYYSGVDDKAPVLAAYFKRHTLQRDQVMYTGDDLLDLPAMRLAGLACAPANAAPEVLAKADMICKSSGGQDCVREIIEAVLKARKAWAIT